MGPSWVRCAGGNALRSLRILDRRARFWSKIVLGAASAALAVDMAAAAVAEDGEEKRGELITDLAFCSCWRSWEPFRLIT